jgi:hypothetical protein
VKRRDVRVWPKADILIAWANVRFRVKSGHHGFSGSCLLMTQSGHRLGRKKAAASAREVLPRSLTIVLVPELFHAGID